MIGSSVNFLLKSATLLKISALVCYFIKFETIPMQVMIVASNFLIKKQTYSDFYLFVILEHS